MMESVNLSVLYDDDSFDITKCIICQKSTGEKTSSTTNGRKRICEYSEIHNDLVLKRIKLMNGEDFVYHMTNDCYRRYTLPAAISTKKKKLSLEVHEVRNSRSQAVHQSPSTNITRVALRNVKCIVCNKESFKKLYIKYRISETNRAMSFLAAANFFQDDVFTRVCDLQDPCSVFGADVYYHKSCMTTYLSKYDKRDSDSKPKLSEKMLAWNQITKDLEHGLKSGKGYELSGIRDRLNIINEKCNFRNKDVKICLINQFGNNIDFAYPSARNKSIMVFSISSDMLADHVRSVNSVDPIQECASMIRKALDDYDFGLDDKFCDAQDLKTSLSNMPIPESILNFFGHLFNFNPDTYDNAANSVMADNFSDLISDDFNDEEVAKNTSSDSTLSVQRCRKIQSLFQIMFYVNHCGRKRTPMHIMNAESVHALGRGGKILTQTLNHEGLAISYSELRRYQHDIASFTAHHNQHRVALPYHFDPGQFTSGAIDTWDHESINVSEHDTVSVLFQDKSPSLRSKPKISDSPVTHGPKAFKDVLPCQVLSKFYKPVHRVDIPANYKVADNIYIHP